jgi:hypothetical protein
MRKRQVSVGCYMFALLIQRLAHTAAVVFHQGALHHEFNLAIDKRRTTLSSK